MTDEDRPHSRWPDDRHTPPAPPRCHLEIELRVDNERTDRVIGLLENILTRVTRLEAQGGRTVVNMKEIQDKLDALSVDVESETDIVTSIDKAFDGQNALILDLGKQLAEALANNDQAALQGVLDSLNAIGVTNAANKARMVAAIVKNTPAEPEPPVAI